MGPQPLLPSLDQQFYRDDHLFVHLGHEVVMLDGQAITLTRIEYRLLALLVEHAGEVVTRATLLTHIGGDAPVPSPRRLKKVAVHIRRLRRKLGVYAEPYIETVPKVGYRFRPPPRP